jgi:DNA-binding NtrC family response regulator
MSKCRILVVDDDPLILAALELMLEPEHHVIGVSTASEAREHIDIGHLDLLLTDYLLGDDRGDWLAAYAEERKVPAILMSGFPNEVDRCRITTPLLVKPFGIDTLLKEIGTTLAAASSDPP